MKPTDRERLLALFQQAANATAPSGEHVCDDAELLTAWRQRDLTVAEEERFFTHLDACSVCRNAVAELAANLPSPAEVEPARRPVARPSRERRLLWTGIVATAACLVIGLVWAFSSREPNDFARAREDLDRGRPDIALDRLDGVRPKTEAERSELMALKERAGYEVAHTHYRESRYDAAAAQCRSMQDRGVHSTRLLELQFTALAAELSRSASGMHFGTK